MQPKDYYRTRSKIKGVFLYGYLRGSGEIYKDALAKGIDVYYMDHAYFFRSSDYRTMNDNSWFRLTKNAMQNYRFKERPEDRWNKYFAAKIQVKPWAMNGTRVMVCPPSDHMKRFDGSGNWENEIIRQITPQAKRLKLSIEVNKKIPGVQKPISWDNIYCIICHTTSLGIKGATLGVPVFSPEECAASLFGSTEIDLDKRQFPERQPALNHLSYSQFTLGEIKSGYALETVDAK